MELDCRQVFQPTAGCNKSHKRLDAVPICKIKDKLILFIHVPRTGGTTIEHHLGEVGTVFFKSTADTSLMRVTAQHLHRSDLNAIFPPQTFDYAFMFVRNPFDRLRSVYTYQKSMRPMERIIPFAPWLRLALMRRKWKPYYRDNHLRPQVEFEAFNAEVFRLEDGIDKAFDRLHELFGIRKPAAVDVLNSRSEPLPALSASDMRLIRETYRADFERYGYDAAGTAAPTKPPDGAVPPVIPAGNR